MFLEFGGTQFPYSPGSKEKRECFLLGYKLSATFLGTSSHTVSGPSVLAARGKGPVHRVFCTLQNTSLVTEVPDLSYFGAKQTHLSPGGRSKFSTRIRWRMEVAG